MYMLLDAVAKIMASALDLDQVVQVKGATSLFVYVCTVCLFGSSLI